MRQQVSHQARCRSQGKCKVVAPIAQAARGKVGIDCQHQSANASGQSTRQQTIGHRRITAHVQLKPGVVRRGPGYVLDRRAGHCGQRIRDTRLGGGPG